MKYIPKHLANEIREKIELVIVPGKSFKEDIKHACALFCQRRIRKAIEENAQINSYRIEHPDLKVPFSVPRNFKRKNLREGVENIKNAFEWGCENFSPENIDEYFIKNLSGKIAPELYKNGIVDYRDTGTRITGASVTPPDPYKVRKIEMPNFINYLKRQLQGEDIINKIEATIYSHLHLVRIHPFVDGNGRTSRILQDIILDYYDIPLPVIESGERNTYYEVLDKAIYDWKHKKHSGEVKKGATEGEHSFYTFMAGKINISLDKLVKCVEPKLY